MLNVQVLLNKSDYLGLGIAKSRRMDMVTASEYWEVKNVKVLEPRSQLRDMAKMARHDGRTLVIFTNGKATKSMESLIEEQSPILTGHR